MILTCPACDTKYVVKDGAIPPAGRQVRCAACKNAWHQAPATTAVDDDALASARPPAPMAAPAREAIDQAVDEVATVGGPPMPAADEDATAAAEIGAVPAEAASEAMVSDYPEPTVAEPPAFANARFAPLTAGTGYGLTAPSFTSGSSEPEPPIAYDPPAVATAAEPRPIVHNPESESWDNGHQFISSFDDEEERGGRGLKIALGLLILIAAVAAAIWFLAPASFKERIGLADASATPLEVMLTTSDRQKLASGNELLAISGRVINPTDHEQAIPPIRASLRNRTTRKMVYQWTIAPPARSLPPRGSASFNSAEVDIPSGGDELTVTLGGAAT